MGISFFLLNRVVLFIQFLVNRRFLGLPIRLFQED